MIGCTASKLRVVLPILGAFALLPSNVLAQNAGLGAAGELVDPDILRVCADPSNMPFTDKNGQGFENKLAELVAKKTGRKSVAYTWFPTVTGFVRNTLGANRCDIIMGYAQGDELVQNTNAYYRSAYVLVYPKGNGMEGIETIEDPKLSGKRIGVVESTPPTANMAANKLLRTAKIYPLAVDTRVTPSMGEVMIKDMLAGKIDAAVLWGPMAGYYARELGADVTIVPLLKEKTGSRMSYRITMGVRPSDQEWKRTLNRVIRENQPEITKLLLGYNVPLIDEHENPITQCWDGSGGGKTCAMNN
ncbi:substrate-binding domain-containing protein [Mesorhizobium sp. M0074]|uniref:substrate-binding domain-containing protein n=1 Tax=unclassified Mesorhizobium TaxID=325217 RepID=UPI0033353C48